MEQVAGKSGGLVFVWGVVGLWWGGFGGGVYEAIPDTFLLFRTEGQHREGWTEKLGDAGEKDVTPFVREAGFHAVTESGSEVGTGCVFNGRGNAV